MDPLAMAILEQSKALTSLVLQLQQAADPFVDYQGPLSRTHLEERCSDRRGKLFLTVVQNVLFSGDGSRQLQFPKHCMA